MQQTIQIADKPTLDRAKHSIWLLDYKTYGTDSYVYRNKDFLYELYRDYEISMNDPFLNSDALIYAEENDELAQALLSIYDVKYDGDTSDIKSISDLITNEIARNALFNSTTATNALFNSTTATNALLNDSTIIEILLNDSTGMEIIANSSIAMNVLTENTIAMDIVANSTMAMTKLINSSTAMNFMYNNYSRAAINKFLESSLLLTICQQSPNYTFTSNVTPISASSATARQIHFNGRCLILGVSISGNLFGASTSSKALVDTLSGTVSTTNNNTNGTNGVVWRINKFANSANCHPEYMSSSTYSTTGCTYMTYLKIN